jgi:hypothetical protein
MREKMTFKTNNFYASEIKLVEKMFSTDFPESSENLMQLAIWDNFCTQMKRNRNLFRGHKPAYTSAFKIQTKKFNLEIHTDSSIVKSFLIEGMDVDAVYQVTFGSKSLVGVVFFKSLIDGTSHDYRNTNLLSWEKAIVSMILNAFELDGPWITLTDMLLTIDKQDSTSRLDNVFRALNITKTEDFSDKVSACGELFMPSHSS